jgi:hypothetical protein
MAHSCAVFTDFCRSSGLFATSATSSANASKTDPGWDLTGLLKETVQQAVKDTAMGKAGGVDGLPPEAFHYSERLWEPLKKLFDLCIETREIPVEWKQALICPVYKKGEVTVTMVQTYIFSYTPRLNNLHQFLYNFYY